jgi:hypothetical protein
VQDEARELTREEDERLQHGHRQLSRSERADQAADRQMLEEMVKRSFVELGAVGFSCHAVARYVQMHAPGYGSLTLGEVELQVDELFSQWCVLYPPLLPTQLAHLSCVLHHLLSTRAGTSVCCRQEG